MPITYPKNRQEIVDRVNTDIQNELPEADPFIRNTAISAISISYSGAVYDLNVNQENLQAELFPNTATGEYAQVWGTMKDVIRNAAKPAQGSISITGNAGITIPMAQVEVSSSNGYKYLATSDAVITQGVRNITSIIRDGSTATVTTTTPHQLATTDTVIIAGANQSEYNITTTIIVIDDTHFSYLVSGTPISPATGTITATAINAYVDVICESNGANTNLSGGASLYFSTIIAGVNSVVHAGADGLVSGVDAEGDIAYRNRYVYAYRNPFSLFNDSSIISFLLQLGYVSRVWVDDITPSVGQVTIYFTTYGEDGFIAIPSPALVDKVKAALVDPTTGIKPANTADIDVIVSAPDPVLVDFVFATIDPDTPSMRIAIDNSLKQSLGEGANVGVPFPEFAYNSTIWQTVDPVTGARLSSFTLTSPTADIPVAAGQLAIYHHDNLMD